MTRNSKCQISNPKSSSIPSNSIFQRTAVNSVTEQPVQKNRETENQTEQQSHFQHDFSQVPIYTANSTAIQPKLKIGAVGDKYEQEADRVARRVVNQMNAPESETVQQVPQLVQPLGSSNLNVVQRMISIADNIYYDQNKIGLPASKIPEWKTNLEVLTGKTASDISTVKLPFPQQNPVLKDALIQKLENNSQIFNFLSEYDFQNFHKNLIVGEKEDITKILQPNDMLNEENDLSKTYIASKACVLQALVNIDVQHPELKEAEQEDPSAWHNLYYNEKGIHYDDDTAMFSIYKSLGLKLILNKPILWKDIDKESLQPGSYIFSMPGHNFGVHLTSDKNYKPKDEPQRRVSNYQENLLIKYVWYKE
jgi:hypothetical protein